MFKLLMSWNIRPGFEDEYFEFIVKEFGPGLAELGIKVTDAWYTQYGDRPQILTGGITGDLESMRRALASSQWQALKNSLFKYVTDYTEKTILADGGFQL